MAVEAGQIAQGTVVRMLPYGVLVRLDDGTQGLVHISEIDQNYVRDVNDYFQVNDPVTVRVLASGERGKVELSVKQALAEGQSTPMRPPGAPPAGDGDSARGEAQSQGQGQRGGEGRGGESGAAPRRESRASFDEKMRDFMVSSNERLGDLKRNIENKRGGKNTRR